MTPEGETKRELKKFLDEWGAYYFMPVQNGYGKSSLDFLVCHAGCFYGLEAKRRGVTKPSARQALTMAEMRKAGAKTYVVTLDERDNLVWVKQ